MRRRVGSSVQLAKHGSSVQLAKHGSSVQLAKHGSSGQLAKHGSSVKLAKHGSSVKLAKHGSSGQLAKMGREGQRLRVMLVVLAIVAATAPQEAEGAVRMSARAPLDFVEPGESLVVRVALENDATPREVSVVGGLRPAMGGEARPVVDLPVSLPPHARKSVVLRFPALAWRSRGGEELAVELHSSDGALLTQAPIDAELRNAGMPVVRVLGAVPRELAVLERELFAFTLARAKPSDLPPRLEQLPPARAWVWDQPRSHELDADQRDVLRRAVLAGTPLIVGLSREEPDAIGRLLSLDEATMPAVAIDELGELGDLGELGKLGELGALRLRAVPSEAGADEDTGAGSIKQSLRGDGGTLDVGEIRLGRGRLVLVAGELDALAADAWRDVLDLPAGGGYSDLRTWGQTRRVMPAALGARMRDLSRTVTATVPRPPIWPAGAVLVAFLFVTVPLDRWLVRRAAKAGRRARGAAWRFPLAVVVATSTAACLSVSASGIDETGLRFDVIDVAPWGVAGGTVAVLGRGRPGDLEIVQRGADVELVTNGVRYFHGELDVRLRMAADPAAPSGEVQVGVSSWELVAWRSRWQGPVEVPVVEWPEGGGTPLVPADATAWLRSADGRPDEWRVRGRRLGGRPSYAMSGHVENAPRWQLAQTLDAVQITAETFDGIDVVILEERAAGPAMTIDGERWEPDRAVTAFLYTRPAPGEGP